ncbi:hypothetical protein GQX74_014081 [Glossina fuscipes]|nr:hypothetical protein GQX74_014081 [Glossina fuscipes]
MKILLLTLLLMAAIQIISMQYNEMAEGTTDTTMSATTINSSNAWEADIPAGDTVAGEADTLLEEEPEAVVLNTLTGVADKEAGHTLVEDTPAAEESTPAVDKVVGDIAKDDNQQFSFKKPSLQKTPLPPLPPLPLTVDEFSRDQLFQHLKNEHNEKLSEAFNKFSRA